MRVKWQVLRSAGWLCRAIGAGVWLFVSSAALGYAPEAAAQVPLTYRLSTLQNPRGLTWYRLDTPHFSVIYPDSLGREAQRVARLLESNYQPLVRSMGKKPPRIPVVLNNQSLTSNAYVGWGPRRSQWYAMPNTTVDGFGPLDWYTLLAKHEGRHIVQEATMRSGWIGLAGRLFGDNTVASLAGNLYFPAWFWEGDAVGMETALSQAGRGRQPSFTARVRALTADHRRYDYHQAWHGSYNTYYPDWYEQGYLLTSYVRRHHGDSAWRRVIARASWNPLTPWALSMALKRETGRTVPQTHRAAVAEIDSLWSQQREAVTETPATLLSPPARDYHVWTLPQYAGDGSVIAAYADLNTVTQLVRLRNGRREVLVKRIGLVGELQFHVQGQRVVWAEYEVDPRYAERTFLVIKRLDLETGKVTRLTDRSRYFGPALSPDGRQIVVVEFSPSRASRIVILDAGSGAVVRALPGDGGFMVTPAWAPDGRSIYVVRVDTTRGNALVRVSLDGSPERTVIDFTHDAISRPTPAGTNVFFGSPRSGLDNIWTVDTVTRAQALVSARKFGASFPDVSVDGTRLLFADYGVGGYDVAEMPLNPDRFVREPAVVRDNVMFADSVVSQEQRLQRTDSPTSSSGLAAGNAEARDWAVRPFSGWARLFDFHSLSLAPTSDGLNTGVVLESRNVLNTFGLNAGVVFNPNERTFAVESGMSYAGLPVIFDAGVRVGSRVSSFVDTSNVERRFSWNERSINLLARLPFTRLLGQRRQSLALSMGLGITDIRNQPVAFRFENNNGAFLPLSYAISASHVRAAAYRDLAQTGVAASAVYRHTPGAGDYDSHIGAARSIVVVPGILPNHVVSLDIGHEEQRPSNYRFSSELVFPRGFSRRYHDRLTRAGVSYQMPLWYPDLALGPLLYARRVQGSLFADAARGSDRTNLRLVQYRSVGGELTAELAPLGTRSTVRVGLRLAQRLTGDRKTTTEWIVSLPQ